MICVIKRSLNSVNILEKYITSPSISKTLEVDIYHFAIENVTYITSTTPPSDYAILLRLSVTQYFAAYLHKAKISLKITSITYAAIRVNSAV